MIVESDVEIVLSNGKFDEYSFSGTVIFRKVQKGDAVGFFTKNWDRKAFKIVTNPITIKFSNE
jgi:hypothetical protein